MNTVAIVGVGLIGGSFGLAIRKAGFTGEILGVSPPWIVDQAVKLGAVSRAATLDEVCQKADLIYLADRVDSIIDLLEMIGPTLRPGCLVTDVGSTKASIVDKASACLRSAAFLGGHPLAGKEVRGVENSDADLFRGRPYVLTGIINQSAVEPSFRRLLADIGARIVEMTPAEHDASVAFTSHLPQLLSTALASTLAHENQAAFQSVFGPGLVDMTRLAKSTPDLWVSILATNQDQVTRAIDIFIQNLVFLRDNLNSDGFAKYFEEAGLYAKRFR